MSLSNTERDALMVDWLYDSLSPADSKRFDELLDKDPGLRAEAESLRAFRKDVVTEYRKLEVVEPPAKLSSIVMHEATKACSPSKGFFARLSSLFEGMAMHPAATAFATLVLVVGVAGALYVRNGDMRVSPEAKSKEVGVFSESKELASEAKQSAAPQSPAVVSKKKENLAAGEDIGDNEEEDRDFAFQNSPARRADLADSATEEGIAQQVSRSKAMAASRASNRQAKKPKGRGSMGVLGGVTSTNAVSGADPESSYKSAVSESYDKKDSRKKSESVRPQATKSEKQAATRSQQKQELLVAGNQGRCEDVARIANDLIETEPGYYRDEVAGEKELLRCKNYVAKESRRRTKLRKTARKRSAEKKSDDGGGGNLRKAKAQQEEVKEAF